MRAILAWGACLILSGCATRPQPPTQTAEAQAELQKLIAGKVAGQPITCLPHYRAEDMVRIDDSTIAFRQGSTVYVNHLRGVCTNLKSSFYALVTHSNGSGLCNGDIAQVRDVSHGMIVGSCGLGDFIPYSKPA